MLNYVFVFLVAAVGMLAGHLIGSHIDKIVPPVLAQTGDGIATHDLEIVGPDGKRQILMATTSEGSPGIWFFDRNGKARMNLGLYGDGNAFIVLNDENDQAVQIFRTVGGTNAPVLVMKSHGQDRIVLGLNFTSTEPFFVYYDDKGTKTKVFGNY